jgi:hypothetical protein
MNVKIGCTLRFTAGAWFNSHLIMNNYTTTLKLLTITADHNNQNIALDRVKYLVEQCLTDTVFICDSETDQIELLRAAGIGVTALPEEPVDQVIGMALFSKFNAIMEGNMLVRSILLSSEAGDDIIYEHDSAEDNHPFENTAGWWNNHEPTHALESAAGQPDTLVILPVGKLWREVGLEWNTDTGVETQENILVFAEFKNDKDK